MKSGSDNVKAAFEANDTLMVIADWTDKSNWVIGEFLVKELKQPNIPVNLFIPGDPAKAPIIYNTIITQNMYVDAINEVGDARSRLAQAE